MMSKFAIPPPNFGVVDWEIYRSGYPSEENLEFLERLGIRSVVYLCKEPCRNQKLLEARGVKLFHVGMEGKKEFPHADKSALQKTMELALRLVADPSNGPLLLHCNAGKHRSGRVVGCLRKLQGWPMAEITREYERFAGDKLRPLDLEFICSFDVSRLGKQLQESVRIRLDLWNIIVVDTEKLKDEAGDIDELQQQQQPTICQVVPQPV